MTEEPTDVASSLSLSLLFSDICGWIETVVNVNGVALMAVLSK